MKNVILTTTFASMFAFSAVVSAAEDIHANQVKVPFYGDQQRLNEHNDSMFKERIAVENHLQGSVDDNRDSIDHLQRSSNNHNAWTQRQEDRLNDHDEQFSNLYETTGQLSQAIQDEQAAREVTEARSVNNAQRLDGTENAIRETNDQQTVDREASLERDNQIVQQVDSNYQWSVDQFNQQANSIKNVRSDVAQVKQDLASERHDRKEQGKDLTAGVATAIAIGSHHFDTNYQGFQLSLSGGAYRGESAVSLSAGGAFTESVFGSISVSNDSRGHQGIGANTTWKF